jgi:putative sterol carrier protein
MADMYNSAGFPGLRCTIQLCFAEGGGGDDGIADWFLHVVDDRCEAHAGTTPFPTLRIRTPIEVWSAIGTGQLDPEQAFTEGRYEADGSIELLTLLPRIFTYPTPAG